MPAPQLKLATPSEKADDPRWNAVLGRDAAHDGEFVFAVSSTGVYCRPSCPSRRPRRENVQFFVRPEQAEKAGYRACLRCRPKSFTGNTEADGAKAICRFIEQHLDEPLTLARLGKEFRQSPFHLQRRFKAVLGITPREYADSCRLRLLKRNLQAGDSVTRAMYDAGYGSSSRLYERTASQLGMTPDKYRRGAIAAAIRGDVFDSKRLTPCREFTQHSVRLLVGPKSLEADDHAVQIRAHIPQDQDRRAGEPAGDPK